MLAARGVVVVPVAAHHRVAARAQFAALAARDDVRPSSSTILISTCGCTRPTVPTRSSSGSSSADLRRDRRGLGHAVADGHLGDVHAVEHLLHDLDGAGRAGHDAGAQRRQIEGGEARVIELGDEHRRHAVERGAALGGDGLEHALGVERLVGDDHGGAEGDAGEVAHDHAEAVIEGHRDADAIALVEARARGRRSSRC